MAHHKVYNEVNNGMIMKVFLALLSCYKVSARTNSIWVCWVVALMVLAVAGSGAGGQTSEDGGGALYYLLSIE